MFPLEESTGWHTKASRLSTRVLVVSGRTVGGARRANTPSSRYVGEKDAATSPVCVDVHRETASGRETR